MSLITWLSNKFYAAGTEAEGGGAAITEELSDF